MHTRSWLWLAVLPLLTAIGLLVREAAPGTWLAPPIPTRWRVATDALLLNTSIAVLVAPVIGVIAVAGARVRGLPGAAGPVTRAIAARLIGFVSMSGLVTTIGYGLEPSALALVAAAHVTLLAALVALAAIGAWCARRFSHPLDAAACSLAVAALAAFGILLGGPLVQDLPHLVVNGALVASPLVATAASAQIDILRTETLYQLSPIAHRRFDYPAWQTATTCYLVMAMLCCGDIFRRSRRR